MYDDMISTVIEFFTTFSGCKCNSDMRACFEKTIDVVV